MRRAILALKNASIPSCLEGEFFGADKGALAVLAAKKPLKAAIGDFDSVSQDEYQAIKDAAEILIQLQCRKDESDTKEAIAHIKKQGYDEIVVIGGLFGRFDHTWANLQLLQCNPDLIWMDEKNRIKIFQPGRHLVYKDDYQYVSFFALQKGKITLENMEYPLDKYEMEPLDSLGLSNEIIGEFGILECDVPTLCIQCHD